MLALDLDFLTSETPDPRIAFAGGANGTRVNALGLIVAASAPRFDYRPVTRESLGLLVEEARTNLATESEFGNGVGDAPTRSGVSAVAFTGLIGATGLSLQRDTGTTVYAYKEPATTAGTVYTFSVFIRMDDGAAPALGAANINSPLNDFVLNVGGAVSGPSLYTIEDYGGGLYRVWFSAVALSSNAYAGVIKYEGNSARGFSTSGWQFEPGSSPTSYIPTGASQVTRSADAASVTGADFSAWYSQAAGTAIVDFDRNHIGGSADRAALDFSAGSWTNRMALYSSVAGRALGVTSSAEIFGFFDLGAPTAKSRQSIALAYAANDFAACMNGGPVSADASGAPPTVDRMTLGSGASLSSLNGHIRRVRFYNERIPNAQIQALTTRITGSGAPVEADDSASGAGRVKITGQAAIVEGDDVATGAGEIGIHLTTPRGRIAVVGLSRLSNRIAR